MRIIALFAALTLAFSAFAGSLTIKGLKPGSAYTLAPMESANFRFENGIPEFVTSGKVPANGTITYTHPADRPLAYYFVDYDGPEGYYFLMPDEDLVVDYSADWFPTYSGSKLMETIAPAERHRYDLGQLYFRAAYMGDKRSQRTALRAIQMAIDSVCTANPASPAALYMLAFAQPPLVEKHLMRLAPAAYEGNALKPLYDRMVSELERRRELIVRPELKNGDMAPDFTLPGLEHKQTISLADYRGKWVVLDFWGTWCGWCIKGIPAMKEAYSRLKDKVEFIGIDCGDTIDQWAQFVRKNELPWVNAFQEPTDLVSVDVMYHISGYPTKMIVDPQGRIVNITVGEDPAFYDILDRFVAQ